MNRLTIPGCVGFMVIGLWVFLEACSVPQSQPSPPPEPQHAKPELSRSRGKELGRGFIVEALHQFRFVKDPEITSLVTLIGREIVSAQGLDPNTYHFFVVSSPNPNAFAIPGGYIFFFDSLLAKMRTPRELAGVMAHEIAHVERNHYFKDEKKLLAVDLATIAAILLSRGDFATIAMAQAANIDLQLQYSRANESEADTYAVQYLRGAGYDPRGLLESFETLAFYERFNSPEMPVYFSTHPGLTERQSHVQLLLRQGEGHQSKRHPLLDWNRIAMGLRAQHLPEKDIPLLVSTFKGESENLERRHYLTGVAYMKTGKYGKAIPELQEAINLNPEVSIYHADLARSFFQLKKIQEAKREAMMALAQEPDQSIALEILGRIEAYEGEFVNSIRFYLKVLQLTPDDPLLHLHLSQSYGKTGEEILEAYHLAVFLRLDLKPRDAIRAFKKARTLVQSNTELDFKIARAIAEIERDGV